ncbi:DUF4386 domain-containing protein [Kribbella catacumbae]|uniref:DUF4386 domain-containing protein n=1 Tax=Kribbella catacumbae TaxID=460086 RepID=UPI00037F2BB3|nr:DUF4386 domain-containing protein [Kribbella catacumbae]
MTTITRSTALPPTIPTDPTNKTALIAGVLYLITFAASIPALPLYDRLVNDPNYILGSGSSSGVLLGGLLEVITAITVIGTAVVLFPVLKQQSERLALGFVTARVLEAGYIVLGVVAVLSVVTLRENAAAGTDPATLVTVGQSLVAIHDWTFLLGPGLIPGVNALLLGTLLYRSRLVPRLIPLMGLIGAPLFLVSGCAVVFGAYDQLSVWSGIATVPIVLWELSLGLWLTFKGFKRA